MRLIKTKILMLGLMTGLAGAQSGSFMPTTIASNASALQAYEVQGEYVGVTSAGDTLGAWVQARGNNSYYLTLLPGGLLRLPGRPGYGGWNRTSRYTGTATWNPATNDYAVTTAAGYNTTQITGAGTAKALVGTGPGGITFSLNRVVRSSPTLRMKPKAEWGTVLELFDSLRAAENPTTEFAKWIANNTAPQVRFGGYLYRGVRTAVTHGAGFLHIEFMSPFQPTATGQNRGNSGVYLHSKYEAQVLDSYGLTGAANETGGIYNVTAPLTNAALPPMTLQTYDIYFTPRTSGANGAAAGAAVMTIYLNGVLVQDSSPVAVTTEAGFSGSQLSAGALFLQDHGNDVVFNNIWFIPSNATTHDELLQSLPYEAVLAHALPVAIRRPEPRGNLPGAHSADAGFLDVMGRRVPENRAPAILVPSP